MVWSGTEGELGAKDTGRRSPPGIERPAPLTRRDIKDGRSLRILTLIDEHSRAYLALKVARRINSLGVIKASADAVCLKGIPEHIRCDDGPEMIAQALRKWVAETGPQIQYIAPVSPWENGSCESLNGELRDECLRQEIFGSLKEAQIVIGLRQTTYNRVRTHTSLG